MCKDKGESQTKYEEEVAIFMGALSGLAIVFILVTLLKVWSIDSGSESIEKRLESIEEKLDELLKK